MIEVVMINFVTLDIEVDRCAVDSAALLIDPKEAMLKSKSFEPTTT